jgi:DNA repair protein RecO (recombination protein O)
LLARGDPHETLFSSYLEALRGLAQSEASNEREAERAREVALRNFELDLLRDVGWLPTLDHAIDGSAIDEQAHYRVDAERGLLPVTRSAYGNGGAGDAITICGRTALALARRDLHNIANDAAAESKGLLRFLIRYHLGGRPLNTRRILQDLKRL